MIKETTHFISNYHEEDYAGIYVWYFMERYGFETFLEVYQGQREWQELIFDGFEGEAITEFIKL